jgi:hypothetical protein
MLRGAQEQGGLRAIILNVPTLTHRRSCVEGGLLMGGGEGPRRARPALLAELEAHLTRRAQALWVVRPERRAGFIEAQRAQAVALEEAVLASRLCHRPRRRHPFAAPLRCACKEAA